MTTIERPGVNAKWLKRMKTWHKGNQKEWYEWMLPDEQHGLEYYVEYGVRRPYDGKPTPLGVSTFGRYTDVENSFVALSLVYEYEFESRSMITGQFVSESARNAFAAHYLQRIVELTWNRGVQFGQTDIAALGYLLGWKDKVTLLTRAWLDDWRETVQRLEDDNINSWPFTTFRQSLLAEHLGLAPYIPESQPLREPILVALLRHWREPDPEKIAPLCLAALDLQTHTSVNENEFANGISGVSEFLCVRRG